MSDVSIMSFRDSDGVFNLIFPASTPSSGAILISEIAAVRSPGPIFTFIQLSNLLESLRLALLLPLSVWIFGLGPAVWSR